MGKIVQTAGRNALSEFAPEFAHFNDDVLFGENWNNQDIDIKTRSIITVVVLMASGITDSSLKYHLQNAKNHGVTQKEIAAVITLRWKKSQTKTPLHCLSCNQTMFGVHLSSVESIPQGLL